MPKFKTNKSAAKRFKRIKRGYKCAKAYHNHLLTKKSPKRKIRSRRIVSVDTHDKKAVAQMLGDRI